MDASAVAQAALALTVKYYREDALNELLLERERVAIGAEDLRSFVAARHFTINLLAERRPVPPAHFLGHGSGHTSNGTLRWKTHMT